MVEASHVAQPATPSLKQHPYPAEEVILVAPVIPYASFSFSKEVASFLTHKYIRYSSADVWMENYFELVTSIETLLDLEMKF
ncbi:hypothetical protein T12_6732 [Trichinella patagoniensis]|uniref:Uncharacterized protein n=1 Tax=Trichinella patagoniensis TaxID=990121 RepID=A0A0V0ZJF1_9BILA|nr:hypothetical protein T12_6732 [Trichinella patagoniensis]